MSISLLFSCATAPPEPAPEREPTVNPERSFAAGDYTEAARIWQQQAISASVHDAGAFRVKAADAWLLAGQADMAKDNLRWVEKSELDPPDQAVMNLVLADLALRANRPDEAELLLRNAMQHLPESSTDRFAKLSEETAKMLSRPGSRDISRTISMTREMTRYQADQALVLLQSLEKIPSGELALRTMNPRGDQNLTAWLDLALVIRQNLVNAELLPQDIKLWKGRHPLHFVTVNDALDLWLRYRQQFKAPARVAVLLPESGRLQFAAQALRDGILSSFLNHPGDSELFFLSTGAEGELTTSAYFEARDLGAELIIGPLQKFSIEALMNLAGLVTPVLALNDLPDNLMAPAGLQDQIYSISLSQDEEAKALAREAIQSGYQRAILLVPEADWGERIAKNIEEEFLHENRQIVVSSRYLESENDHSQVLERLLKIDESKARKQKLENTLQMTLEFEPVRRDDVDVLFLAANFAQGRSIRPQLRFNFAGDIPVYATGRIFSGRPDPAADQDLNGVRFPITPFQLGIESSSSLPDLSSLRGGSFAALFALGKDAWDLLPWLTLMQNDPDFRVPGAAGYYHTNPDGKIERQPEFAEFQRGRPSRLQRSGDGPIVH